MRPCLIQIGHVGFAGPQGFGPGAKRALNRHVIAQLVHYWLWIAESAFNLKQWQQKHVKFKIFARHASEQKHNPGDYAYNQRMNGEAKGFMPINAKKRMSDPIRSLCTPMISLSMRPNNN